MQWDTTAVSFHPGYMYLKSTLQPDSVPDWHEPRTVREATGHLGHGLFRHRRSAYLVDHLSADMQSSYPGHCVRVQPLSEAPLFKTPARASKGMVCTNHPIASAAGVEMFAVVTCMRLFCTKYVVTPEMRMKSGACSFARGETLSMPPSRPSSACPWLSL